MEVSYSYKKIIIPEQKEVYRHKNILLELGLTFDSFKKLYVNNEELSSNLMEELEWICKKNQFKYEILDEIITDKDKIIQNKYSLISIDNNSFFIQDRKTKKKFFGILIDENFERNLINFIDIENGKFLSLSTKFNNNINKIVEIVNILIENAKELSSKDFDIDYLIYILSIISDKFDKDNRLSSKINKFKNKVISEITKNNSNNFLCNCVPGFYPEISFYLRDKKIINSSTNNPIDFKQETKIWDYLYKQENRKYIGVRKKPTLKDLFFRKKINATINGFFTKPIITKIEEIDNKLKIHISDDLQIIEVKQLFTKEELFKKVIEAR